MLPGFSRVQDADRHSSIIPSPGRVRSRNDMGV
jgi:hypothetical protein